MNFVVRNARCVVSSWNHDIGGSTATTLAVTFSFRFAIEALVLGVETNTSKLSTKSIDDEYAPAAFTTEEILWRKRSVSTFHKWRAVSCFRRVRPFGLLTP